MQLGCDKDDRRRFPAGAGILFFATALRSALRPAHPSRLSDGLQGVSTKAKKLRLEDDYWTPNRVAPKYCAKLYPHSPFVLVG